MEYIILEIDTDQLYNLLNECTDHNIKYFMEQVKKSRTNFEKVIKTLKHYDLITIDLIGDIKVGAISLYDEYIINNEINPEETILIKKIDNSLYLVVE